MNSHRRSDLRAGEIKTCSGSFHLTPSNDLRICERLTRARQIKSKTASTTAGMNHNIRLFKKFITTFHARCNQAVPELNLQFSICRRQFQAAGNRCDFIRKRQAEYRYGSMLLGFFSFFFRAAA
jgi:hypothetical protein